MDLYRRRQLSSWGDAIWAFQDWLELANLQRQNQMLVEELQQKSLKEQTAQTVDPN
ncbi:hypothetical protein HJG54_31685 [Leptolyngbya sp. NK1-12]|uniref:Uncharacterized protein n=1 Tax=Leptolyngbya sp. NK1-12 TaxID=2547451 RepID=A0AA96WK75_9CYAN|nr:hypothetical protein [Leptolyngbya sp. NK1-12]WNZ27442.1 hypothetical protein HJG54_31685 [Leptolyngbya sp. NK1-12]